MESVIALAGSAGAFSCEAGELGFFTGKDGILYAIDLANGQQVWQYPLGFVPGYGSIATPATDRSNVVTQSGALSDPTQNAVPGSKLYDVGVDGALRSPGPQPPERRAPLVLRHRESRLRLAGGGPDRRARARVWPGILGRAAARYWRRYGSEIPWIGQRSFPTQ